MTNVVRFLQFFALGTWVGGIIFLSFVEAPGVFGVLGPHRDQAGNIVGYSLTRLHYIGVVAALIYLVAGFAIVKSAKWLITPAAILVMAMLALTAISQFAVRPRMAVLRAEMVSIDATPPENTLRARFDRLHRLSVQLEGATLLAGVVAIFLTVRGT
ncbi:MAG TPA: DUF4149 domain-containing protein [Candidatus Cybelea sp.]|nr:DUF4149 domain-containing protein [Candidatus Cybelea sp.]